MNEAQLEERFHLLEQEVALTGESLENLQRDSRAEIDALRLEVTVLQRCLYHLYPESQAAFDAIKADVIQQVNPETT